MFWVGTKMSFKALGSWKGSSDGMCAKSGRVPVKKGKISPSPHSSCGRSGRPIVKRRCGCCEGVKRRGGTGSDTLSS